MLDKGSALKSPSKETWASPANSSIMANNKRDLRALVSPTGTVSFRVDYVIFAGFWAGRFNSGQAGSVPAASPISRWHNETSHNRTSGQE
jgi:hypothetical protein